MYSVNFSYTGPSAVCVGNQYQLRMAPHAVWLAVRDALGATYRDDPQAVTGVGE